MPRSTLFYVLLAAAQLAECAIPLCTLKCLTTAAPVGCSIFQLSCLCRTPTALVDVDNCVQAQCAPEEHTVFLDGLETLCDAAGVSLTPPGSSPTSTSTSTPSPSPTPTPSPTSTASTPTPPPSSPTSTPLSPTETSATVPPSVGASSSAADSSPTASESPRSSGSSRAAVIGGAVGGVIGGFILLALLALCVIPIIHRRREARSKETAIREYHDKDDLPDTQFRAFTLTGEPTTYTGRPSQAESYNPFAPHGGSDVTGATENANAPPSAFVARPFIVPPVATTTPPPGRPRKGQEEFPTSPVSRATSEYGSGGRAGSVRRLSESLTRRQLEDVQVMASRGVQGKEMVDAIENMIRDNYRTTTGVPDDDDHFGPPQYDDAGATDTHSRRS